jgi:CRISPR/Cas system type I-B associated protein Csh2 (Cas7 group RAMP superfamily)
MEADHKNNGAPFNRGTGLLIIEVRYSNPNGDPDAESDPRMIDANGRGLISPVSFKRKLRDLVANKDGFAWASAMQTFRFETEVDKRTILRNTRRGLDHPTEKKEVKAKYNVLETRFREREKIEKMDAFEFAAEFWDARLFGNTFLEGLKDKDDVESGKTETGKDKKTKKLETLEKRDHFISTGVVQFGPGISIAPISVIRDTWTNKAGVEEGKDRGMAPLAWRVVQHAVYVMPFFINPCMAIKTSCGLNDLRLMQFMIPHAYPLNPSVARPHVEIRHAWYAEHKSPLGSCPDSLIIDALTPKKTKGNVDEPSTSIEEYEPIPRELPTEVWTKLENFDDLCTKQWS